MLIGEVRVGRALASNREGYFFAALCSTAPSMRSEESRGDQGSRAPVDVIGESWSAILQFHEHVNFDDPVAISPSETSWSGSASRSPCAK